MYHFSIVISFILVLTKKYYIHTQYNNRRTIGLCTKKNNHEIFENKSVHWKDHIFLNMMNGWIITFGYV